MVTQDQAQADLTAQQTPVVDPLDATNSPNNGTNELESAYEAEAAAFLANFDSEDEQGEEPVYSDEEEQQEEEEALSEEESEEQSDELEEEEEEEPEAKAPKRIRLKRDEDIAIAAIARARDIPLSEATDIYRGQPKAQESAPAQTREEAQAPTETVASVEARIAELDNLESESNSALNFEQAGEHRKEANALRNRLIDLKFAEMQQKAQSEQEQNAKFLADYRASEEWVIQRWPTAGVAGSPMQKEILRLEAIMLKEGDPNYYSPDKPQILARRAAVNTKTIMEQPGKAPVPARTVQRRPVPPASGNARTSSPNAHQAFEQDLDSVTSLDEYEARFQKR